MLNADFITAMEVRDTGYEREPWRLVAHGTGLGFASVDQGADEEELYRLMDALTIALVEADGPTIVRTSLHRERPLAP